MSRATTFVLPEGLDIDFTSDELSFEYDGDVQLGQTLGKKIGRIVATGDLVIRAPEITGELIAGGKLVLNGTVNATRLHGREVHVGKQEVNCPTISADERIVVGAARIQAQVLIAPEIVLDPLSTGRVQIIESRNDTGPTKIRGGFRLVEAEADGIIANAIEYLQERGLKPLPAHVPKPHTPTP